MFATPYIIEFTGTPDSGKTTVINALESIFSSKDLRVHVIHECTTSNIKGIDRRKWNGYLWIRLRMLKELLEVSYSNEYDIILVDRGIFDGLFWLKIFYEDNRCNKTQYDSMKNFLINCIPVLPNLLFVFYTSAEKSIIRKINSGSTNTDPDFISFYNSLLIPFYKEIVNQKKIFIDTSELHINELIKSTEEYVNGNLYI